MLPFLIPAALGAAQLFGGLLGRPKGIDMAAWERMFGPQAMSALTNQFMSQFSQSPFARQQEIGAANTGQQIANQYAAMPGARLSGVGQISQALSGGATQSLQQQLQSMIFQMAMQAAQQHMAQKQDIFMQNQRRPSFLQQLGPAMTGAASQTLSMLPAKVTQQPPTAPASFWDEFVNPKPPTISERFPMKPLSFFDQFLNRAVGAR